MDEQALKHLRGDRYQKLFAAVRERLERSGEKAVRAVTLHDLTPEECDAIADLHGWSIVPAPPLRISIGQLDEALRTSRLGAGLLELLEALWGPLRDLPSEREVQTALRREVWQEAREHPALKSRPDDIAKGLDLWLEEIRKRGLLRRASKGGPSSESTLLQSALRVVGCLPSTEGLTLPLLAVTCTGDPHALDPDRPLSVIVQRALLPIAGWTVMPVSASDRRRLWADVGVACDPLSCDVLVLGLRPPVEAGTDRLLVRHLRELADAGEPRRITLRELAGQPLGLQTGTEIFVCENPGIVAMAADLIGSDCAPIICTEGIPSSAALRLLEILSACGAQLRIRADFDWTGIRIVNQLFSKFSPASPWRFSEGDYRSAIESLQTDALALDGTPATAHWDSGLSTLMATEKRAVFEEQLAMRLIEDLKLSSSCVDRY